MFAAEIFLAETDIPIMPPKKFPRPLREGIEGRGVHGIFTLILPISLGRRRNIKLMHRCFAAGQFPHLYLVTGFTATHGGHCCRCFLPDLTGFTSLRCAGPGHTIYKLEIYKTAFN